MNEDMQELISVLIPAYNRERYIKACIESMLAQTYRNIQVIVYDDGSTDRTVEIVRSIKGVRLIEGGANKGVSHARNRLLEACETRYAAWQDSDDIAAPSRIERQYREICETGKALVFCYCVNMAMMSSNAAEEIRCMGGVMFDAGKAKAISFNEEIKWGAEDTLWLLKVQSAHGEAGLVPSRLYYIRMHPDRISSKKRLPCNRKAREASDRAYSEELKKMKK
jgi:glycosyltransferase involved in cell wall biosynthesis